MTMSRQKREILNGYIYIKLEKMQINFYLPDDLVSRREGQEGRVCSLTCTDQNLSNCKI